MAATNLALGKSASQSSTYGTAEARLAVDGVASEASCTMNDVHPWLAVDLGTEYDVDHVVVVNDVDQHSNYY